MATDLVESGVVVVALAEKQAALVEAGVVVITKAEEQAALVESGLLVIAQAELNHKLVESGIIVIWEDVAPSGGPGIQGALEAQGVAQGSGIANLGPSAVGVN